ncbi:hypothetical protein OQI89_08955 [Lentilactobacillus diolivorans]|mgnify:CR=1 FL=1|uniref:hypothetical protein n=1 Tax=Lentilactobacillus diolivorans TaxID=179838 RepID=UPI0024689D03|nr:hypothetical protein [Lentilactobacillus diolivorans]MDH5105978.1 hypothetical protein [Lentilactobacillus diolivorans]
MFGSLVIVFLLTWYGAKYYYGRSNQANSSTNNEDNRQPKETSTPANESTQKTPNNDELSSADEKREGVFKEVIEQVNYFSGEIRFIDLVYLINIVLFDRKLPEVKDNDDALRGTVTKVIYQKLEPILDSQKNHWTYDNYKKGLVLLSLLPFPNSVIGNFFDNLDHGDKSEKLLDAKIREFLWSGSIDTVIQAVSLSDAADDIHLQQGERLVYIDNGDLYENRVTHHRVSYNGVSGSTHGIHAGSYDYDRESFSDLVNTVSGTIYITTKRIVIEGYNNITDQQQTKVITLGSIVDCYQDGHRIHISRNGGDIYLSVGLSDEFENDPSLEINTKLIRQILGRLLNPSESEKLSVPVDFSFGKDFGDLIYTQGRELALKEWKTDKDLDKFINSVEEQIMQLFNGYLKCSHSWDIDSATSVPSFDTTIVSVEGSEYFRNLVIKQPKEWFLKNLELIRLQNQLNLFQADNQKSWSLQITDFNYKNKSWYVLFHEGLLEFVNNEKKTGVGNGLRNIYKDRNDYV